ALAVLLAAGGRTAIAAEIEVVRHRQIGENPPALRHVDEATRDDCWGALVLNGVAGKADAAAPATHDAGNRGVERRFAGAVRAEHGDDLAFAYRKVDAAQNFGLAISGAQALHVEQRLSGHARAP